MREEKQDTQHGGHVSARGSEILKAAQASERLWLERFSPAVGASGWETGGWFD